jgi:hypothetical protein
MISLKRKAAFLGQQTYCLNARVQSQEQRSKRLRLNTERPPFTGSCANARNLGVFESTSAEEVVALAGERHQL